MSEITSIFDLEARAKKRPPAVIFDYVHGGSYEQMILERNLDERRWRCNTVERLNKEVKRRADVAGILPGESAILRLIGAVPLEANDEWAIQHRYMQVEAIAQRSVSEGAGGRAARGTELLAPPLIEGEATPADDTQATPKAA